MSTEITDCIRYFNVDSINTLNMPCFNTEKSLSFTYLSFKGGR